VAYYTITLSDGSLSQRTDAFALQLETHARDAPEWSLVGTSRADGALGKTDAERFIESYPMWRKTPNSSCNESPGSVLVADRSMTPFVPHFERELLPHTF